MKKLKLFFYLLFTTLSLSAQTSDNLKAFDSIYYEIAVNVIASNPTKALHLADSLYNYSFNDKQRIKSLMLSASVYEKQEKRLQAIEYALKSLEVAKKIKDYSFQARIYGFMSTNYRQLGFSDKGREYIQKGLDISSNIKDKDQLTKYKAMANHELADYAMDDNEYEKAINYINLALLGYYQEENPRFKDFQIANVEELLGRCNLALGNNEQAFEHFSTANKLIVKSEASNSIWAAMIYQGMATTYLEKKQIDSAEVYLNKGLTISENTNHGTLKELLYESMSNYYKTQGKLDSSVVYALKYRNISKENKFNKNRMINGEVNRITAIPETEKKNIKDIKDNSNVIYIGSSIVIGIGIIVVLYFYRRKKSEILENSDSKEKSENHNGLTISPLVEEELLIKLGKFENSENFIDKNMSFAGLVSYLNTNAKYLNYILKTKKNKDFNTYINDLRIEYVLLKLEPGSEYLNYKISYLADISGFSSHSNFSANFKRVTEFSPSEYIEGINKSV